jgi:hypothetical protein
MNAASASVGVLDIIGCRISNPSTGDGYGVILNNASASIGQINFTGGEIANCYCVVADGSTGSTVTTFSGGFTVTACRYGALPSGTGATKTYVFAGCLFSSVSTDLISVTSSSVVIRGDLLNTSGIATVLARAASESVEVVAPQFQVDVSQLIRTGGGRHGLQHQFGPVLRDRAMHLLGLGIVRVLAEPDHRGHVLMAGMRQCCPRAVSSGTSAAVRPRRTPQSLVRRR